MKKQGLSHLVKKRKPASQQNLVVIENADF